MILKPKWKITRDEDHSYTVHTKPNPVFLPGTTGILDIVGSKEKINRLCGWAKKQALLKVAEHIRTFSGKPLLVDEAWVESVRKSAWKKDKEKLKEAGDLGTAVHAAIDDHIAGREPKLDEKTKPGFDNFLLWKKQAEIKLIKGDTYVASMLMGYGGALDALGMIDGKLVLLDWKTGNSLYDTAALQVAAYSEAFMETFGRRIHRSFVVRLGKETPGDIDAREVNLELARGAFLAALELHRWMKQQLWGGHNG